jgi:hypothetical protein
VSRLQEKISAFGLYSLAANESSDVSNTSQFFLFIRGDKIVL